MRQKIEVAVQDDHRETEMRQLVGLRTGEGRSGIDAYFDFTVRGRHYAVPIELKSTTVGSVSTARDVGPEHIEKWRSRVWLFGFYDSSGTTLERLLALGPDEMEPWISRIERYIAPDFLIGERAAMNLGIDDMHVICGEKPIYTLEDAKALYKRQWSETDYLSHMDCPNGYSPRRDAPGAQTPRTLPQRPRLHVEQSAHPDAVLVDIRGQVGGRGDGGWRRWAATADPAQSQGDNDGECEAQGHRHLRRGLGVLRQQALRRANPSLPS